MKHIKRFMINENKKVPQGLISFEEIKDYFYDLIDEEFVMKEEPIENPYIKDSLTEKDLIKNGDMSSYPVMGYGKYVRKIFLRKSTDLSKFSRMEFFEYRNKLCGEYLKLVKTFKDSEKLEISDIYETHGDGYIILSFTFIQKIESKVENVSEDLSHLSHRIKRYLFSSKGKFNANEFDYEITKDNKIVIRFDNSVSSFQMKTIIQYLHEFETKVRQNAVYANRENPNSGQFYYKFTVGGIGGGDDRYVVVRDIQKIVL